MEKVTIFEMGPRDGLQNEAAMISTADKIALVDMLTAVGFQKIEVTRARAKKLASIGAGHGGRLQTK